MKLCANDSITESPSTATRTHTGAAKQGKSGHVKARDFLIKQVKLCPAGLEERIDCYKKTCKSIRRYVQYKSLTEIRVDDLDYRKYSVDASRSSLNRLDKAFKNSFRHFENGEAPSQYTESLWQLYRGSPAIMLLSRPKPVLDCNSRVEPESEIYTLPRIFYNYTQSRIIATYTFARIKFVIYLVHHNPI